MGRINPEAEAASSHSGDLLPPPHNQSSANIISRSIYKLTRVDALHDFDTAPFAQFAVGQGGPVEWVGTSLIGKTVAFEALDFVSR